MRLLVIEDDPDLLATKAYLAGEWADADDGATLCSETNAAPTWMNGLPTFQK